MLSPLPSPQTISCGALHFVIPPVPARRGTEPRSSYCAAPSMATRAAFLEGSRMNLVSATEPYRKSGGSGGICSFLPPTYGSRVWAALLPINYQKAHSPLRIRGSTLPVAVMPSKLISLDPIIQSTWIRLSFAPLAASSSGVSRSPFFRQVL